MTKPKRKRVRAWAIKNGGKIVYKCRYLQDAKIAGVIFGVDLGLSKVVPYTLPKKDKRKKP